MDNSKTIAKLEENIKKLEELLQSEEVLKLKRGQIQMMVDQKWLCGVMIEALKKEVQK